MPDENKNRMIQQPASHSRSVPNFWGAVSSHGAMTSQSVGPSSARPKMIALALHQLQAPGARRPPCHLDLHSLSRCRRRTGVRSTMHHCLIGRLLVCLHDRHPHSQRVSPPRRRARLMLTALYYGGLTSGRPSSTDAFVMLHAYTAFTYMHTGGCSRRTQVRFGRSGLQRTAAFRIVSV